LEATTTKQEYKMTTTKKLQMTPEDDTQAQIQKQNKHIGILLGVLAHITPSERIIDKLIDYADDEDVFFNAQLREGEDFGRDGTIHDTVPTMFAKWVRSKTP
jgi:hypothetical protein